jgi:hypothetical protein
MISLHDRASLEAASHLQLDERLRPILLDRIKHYETENLLYLTHLLIIWPGDTEQDIAAETGLSPLVNPLDGSRYGSPAFQPWWDWLQRHDGWFELIVTSGNSGFAFVLFIQDAPGADPDLIALCRTFAA